MNNMIKITVEVEQGTLYRNYNFDNEQMSDPDFMGHILIDMIETLEDSNNDRNEDHNNDEKI